MKFYRVRYCHYQDSNVTGEEFVSKYDSLRSEAFKKVLVKWGVDPLDFLKQLPTKTGGVGVRWDYFTDGTASEYVSVEKFTTLDN
jgi:hypothetical protein